MYNSATQRVVALVDMDCFYCQVEARLNPTLKGKPMAVVQYNQWKGGGIIAVNYEARDLGVSRHMRGDEAKEICPEIILVSVPTIRGKADLSKYRDAGDEVAKVFLDFSDCVQRASIDEAYLDLTKAVGEYIKEEFKDIQEKDLPNTFVLGHCDSKSKSEDERKKGLAEWLKLVNEQKLIDCPEYRLAVGGIIIEKMRQEILNRTGFHCSAGIAHNKILAKLTAGLHKPKRQTLLPQDSIPELYETLPIYKVRSLGGKFGKVVAEKLSIKYMSELYKFSLQELQQKFDEKSGSWLYNIARGIDLDPVTSRLKPESIGCCKNFTGKAMLTTRSEVENWLKELASEISERLFKDLERNKRRAKLLTVSFYQESAMTRCGSLNSYEVSKIVKDALDLIKKFNTASSSEDVWNPPIKYLGLSASKFTEELSSIEKYFKNCKKPDGAFTAPDKDTSSNVSAELNKENKSSENKLVPSGTSEPGTSRNVTSFFMNFINKTKDICPKEEEGGEDNRCEEGEEENEPMWISLSEVFPDIHEVQEDVIEILPEALQKKLKKRISEDGDPKKEVPSKEEKDEGFVVEKETCSECGKRIPLTEFLEHVDYHAALNLHTEMNKTTAVNAVVKVKMKEQECNSKRKKKGVVTPSKKMKSITSFFNVLPK